jgi:hypothetical protein
MRSKERGLLLIGFIASCQNRSYRLKPNGASSDTPLRLRPLERRSGCLPALPYPPSRPIAFYWTLKTFVAFESIKRVENLVPNVCTVAGFEVATYGRF